MSEGGGNENKKSFYLLTTFLLRLRLLVLLPLLAVKLFFASIYPCPPGRISDPKSRGGAKFIASRVADGPAAADASALCFIMRFSYLMSVSFGKYCSRVSLKISAIFSYMILLGKGSVTLEIGFPTQYRRSRAGGSAGSTVSWLYSQTNVRRVGKREGSVVSRL